jgi:C-terminal processing protease CtpA/Prc
MDFYKLLNRKAGKYTLLSVFDPATNKRAGRKQSNRSLWVMRMSWYKRWVRQRRAEVDKPSGGRIGYVHVRAMNDASMRTVVEEARIELSKEAIIVDTRFNGGGNIHEQLPPIF